MPFNAPTRSDAKPCQGLLFNINSKECQGCHAFTPCRELTPPSKNVVVHPVGLAILRFLTAHRNVSVVQINKHLRTLFGNKRINTYNWIGVLKTEGLLNISNKGRCRVYSLR